MNQKSLEIPRISRQYGAPPFDFDEDELPRLRNQEVYLQALLIAEEIELA